jgi:hypothetical protein
MVAMVFVNRLLLVVVVVVVVVVDGGVATIGGSWHPAV